ncbi:pleckstrin homology domain-containing family G member 7-like [Pollicipes pollicipes]|uniref:pleckstrin homology domain-containing family G member 7-like n=1 Tax=Pollicipes pollicipes TaxID=41117 RepID=UPI001884C1FE|nr:pleckstrin homology domain-containing family G member 7-like [Pollicipes pollicipes]
MLRDIQAKTESAADRQIISTIIETEENSLRELDDKMKWLKNFERLLEIQRNLVWPSVMEMDPKAYIPEFLRPALARQPCERLIVSPRRQIIMEGPLQLADAGKPIDMHVILFDDMLLITRRKKGLSKKKSSITDGWSGHHCRGSAYHEAAVRYVVHKQPLSLDRFFLHNIVGQDVTASRLEGAFVVVHLNRFQQIAAVFTLLAQSEQVKTMWINKLREAQEKWKRTLQNTVFREWEGALLPLLTLTEELRTSNMPPAALTEDAILPALSPLSVDPSRVKDGLGPICSSSLRA